MKRLIVVTLALMILPFPAALFGADDKPKELTDPLEILKRVDAAAKKVKVAKYHVTFKQLDDPSAPAIEGRVILSGWSGGMAEKFFAEVTVKHSGGKKTTKVTIGGDGEEFFVIDHANKKAYVDMDPQVLGSTGRPARALFMAEFVHSTPFSDEINGMKQELRGSKTIGGVDCYEIFVQYSAGQEAVWHFGKKDFLPRARLDIRTNPQGQKRRTQRILTNLVVDSAVNESVFKLTLPDGFEKIDDFAP